MSWGSNSHSRGQESHPRLAKPARSPFLNDFEVSVGFWSLKHCTHTKSNTAPLFYFSQITLWIFLIKAWRIKILHVLSNKKIRCFFVNKSPSGAVSAGSKRGSQGLVEKEQCSDQTPHVLELLARSLKYTEASVPWMSMLMIDHFTKR